MSAAYHWTTQQDQQLLALAEEGAGVTLIATRLGRSVYAVQNHITKMRARGITVQIKRGRPSGLYGECAPHPSVRQRPCLCCGDPFPSDGPQNRLCDRCRLRNVSPYAPGARA